MFNQSKVMYAMPHLHRYKNWKIILFQLYSSVHSSNNFALHYIKQNFYWIFIHIYMYNHCTHPLEIYTPYIFQWILNDFSITIKMKTKQKNGFMCIRYYTVLQLVFINIEFCFNVSQWLDMYHENILYIYIHYNSTTRNSTLFCV